MNILIKRKLASHSMPNSICLETHNDSMFQGPRSSSRGIDVDFERMPY